MFFDYIITYIRIFTTLESICWLKFVARSASLNFDIASTCNVFIVINLGVVIFFRSIQRLMKHGKWSDMLLIITAENALLLRVSWCTFGTFTYIWSIKLQLLATKRVGTVIYGKKTFEHIESYKSQKFYLSFIFSRSILKSPTKIASAFVLLNVCRTWANSSMKHDMLWL